MWYTLFDEQRTGDGQFTAQVKTDPDSPWYDGHFSGDPVLPGIAQLDMVAELIRRQAEGRPVLQGLSRVKFRQRIQPGQVLKIIVSAGREEQTYSFRMTTEDEQLVSSGVMRFFMSEPGAA